MFIIEDDDTGLTIVGEVRMERVRGFAIRSEKDGVKRKKFDVILRKYKSFCVHLGSDRGFRYFTVPKDKEALAGKSPAMAKRAKRAKSINGAVKASAHQGG